MLIIPENYPDDLPPRSIPSNMALFNFLRETLCVPVPLFFLTLTVLSIFSTVCKFDGIALLHPEY